MPGPVHFTVQNTVYCWPGGACWAAGQCSTQGPVMCGAGLNVRACGGGVGVDARRSGAFGSSSLRASAAHAGFSCWARGWRR